jgi:hypothetical protein
VMAGVGGVATGPLVEHVAKNGNASQAQTDTRDILIGPPKAISS